MKVLVVSPDQRTRTGLAQLVDEWGHDPMVVPDALTAWSRLQDDGVPSLVIVDEALPGTGAEDLCREVRRTVPSEPYVYIVVLGSNDTLQHVEKVHTWGADDFIVRLLERGHLERRLSSVRRILDLQSKLKVAWTQLQDRSTRDPLTGLLNRAAILSVLDVEMERVRREGGQLGVVMMDLDSFKQINDTRGHLIGDAVLCEVGNRLSQAGRRYDLMGRYGGDEFLVVLPGCSLSQARSVANRLRARISQAPIVLPEDMLFVTSTAGATSWSKGDIQPNDLIALADQALYLAKERGRDRSETVPHIPKGFEPLRRYRVSSRGVDSQGSSQVSSSASSMSMPSVSKADSTASHSARRRRKSSTETLTD